MLAPLSSEASGRRGAVVLMSHTCLRQCGLWPLLLLALLASCQHASGTSDLPSTGTHAARRLSLEATASVNAKPQLTPAAAANATAERCVGMRGDWCQQAAVRQPLPFKPPPRGDKSCPDNCSNIGNCHHGTGRCMCPAGYTGPSCAQPQKRPCTAKHRVNYDRPLKETQSHVDATGHDLNVSNPLWTASRCAGAAGTSADVATAAAAAAAAGVRNLYMDSEDCLLR